MRVLAAAIILLFFYYAAGVVITLLLSILLAYFLDPAVEFLEKWRVPRTVGAMIMVLILIAVLVAAAMDCGHAPRTSLRTGRGTAAYCGKLRWRWRARSKVSKCRFLR